MSKLSVVKLFQTIALSNYIVYIILNIMVLPIFILIYGITEVATFKERGLLTYSKYKELKTRYKNKGIL